MSDREILLHWLAAAAARLGWSRRVLELGWFACALAVLPLLAQLLRALGAPAPVRSALLPLLIMAALAVLTLFIWRLARSATLAQAASVADIRAGLNDELKSAHWFAQRAARDAFVDLLLTRAARTAQRLDARRLFPLRVPRSMFAALALAIFTGALAWFSPRIALPVMRQPLSSPAVNGDPRHAHPAQNEAEKNATELASPDSAARLDPSAKGSPLDPMTAELPSGTEDAAIQRAADMRDAGLVAQLLQALQHKHADPAQPEAAAHAPERAAADAAEHSLGARQPEPPNEEDKAHGPTLSPATEPSARVSQRLREQGRQERRKMEGQPAQGQVELNNRLRAISRNGTSMRKVAYGEGQAAEAGSRTSVSGAATGERAGRSRSGDTEGESPQNGPTGDADTQPVLGQQTLRVQGQVQKTRMERNDPQDVEEAFYAATQRQAAQVEYQASDTQWQTRREAAIASPAIPLSYQDGVKRYFLMQHSKEDE